MICIVGLWDWLALYMSCILKNLKYGKNNINNFNIQQLMKIEDNRDISEYVHVN